MSRKKVFSGIQPTGNLHLGNYLGAILNWVRNQDEKENIFCIVDLHAITLPQEQADLQKRIIETAKIYLAAGIDPQKSSIFVQSSLPEHSELAWILNNFTYFGEMNRMTQFKDKANNKDNVTVGLFDYPVLMAADILLYDTDEVPVGDDQKQHVEICRDIAERFNKRYKKNIFVIPKPVIEKESARIMSLLDPNSKMSKSDENDGSRINLTDTSDVIRKKFARAVTDSGSEIKFDVANKPGISNLLNILSSITQKPISELEKEYSNKNYGQFKTAVAETVIELLEPIQQKIKGLDDQAVITILKEGSNKVGPIAQKTLSKVKKTVGLGI
ncbi:MAG: tryptophan--tRNA ligase [bacterium]